MGDFNDFLYSSDKDGGRIYDSKDLRNFNGFMEDLNMMEVDLKGGQFTWMNRRQGEAFIKKKLDRIVCNKCWFGVFEKAQGFILEAVGSDHSPILLCFEYIESRTPWKFKFESFWVDDPEFLLLVRENWCGKIKDVDLVADFERYLAKIKKVLTGWSREKFLGNKKLIEELLVQFRGCYTQGWGLEEAKRAKEVAAKLEELSEKEEKYWAQRSRVQWLRLGDQNTLFFHQSTLQRRRHNKILRTKDESGGWLDNQVEIESAFAEYFKNLFTTEGQRDFSLILQFVEPVVTEEMNENLLRKVEYKEVKEAAFQLGALKAPGPNGFLGIF